MVNWKVLGIISIIFNVLLLLFIFGVSYLGFSLENAEIKCANEICFNQENAVLYNFDIYSSTCQCIDINNNIVYQEVLG